MRRGNLEWSLETLGKLIFYAIIILFLIWMVFKLSGILLRAQQDSSAEQNLNLLLERIRDAEERENVTLITSLPPSYVILGFDAGVSSTSLTERQFVDTSGRHHRLNDLAPPQELVETSKTIPRPPACSKKTGCLCAYKIRGNHHDGFEEELLVCEKIKQSALRGMTPDETKAACANKKNSGRRKCDWVGEFILPSTHKTPLLIPDAPIFLRVRVVGNTLSIRQMED